MLWSLNIFSIWLLVIHVVKFGNMDDKTSRSISWYIISLHTFPTNYSISLRVKKNTIIKLSTPARALQAILIATILWGNFRENNGKQNKKLTETRCVYVFCNTIQLYKILKRKTERRSISFTPPHTHTHQTVHGVKVIK